MVAEAEILRMAAPIGPAELIIVLVIVLVLFGAKRLGDLGGSLGRGIREFREATREEQGSAEDAEA